MKFIQLEIATLSALAIGRHKPGGSISETEDYIPGAVLRGAIGGVILQRANRDTPQIHQRDLRRHGGDFSQLFLDENAAIFCNAYPAIASLNKNEKRFVRDRVYWLPSTALSSKTDGGFRTQEKHGVFDTLIDRFCADACSWNYDPLCPQDGGRVEAYSGFYSRSNPKEYRSHSVDKRYLTRVGIDRRRATAADEILYSIQVINEEFVRDTKAAHLKWERMAFLGVICVEDDGLGDRLIEFINKNPDRFRLGGSTSRGLGKVLFKATEIAGDPTLKTRIDTFNNAFKQRALQWQKVLGHSREILEPNRFYFTIGLQSDAILRDRWQRTTVISPEMLREYVGISDPSLRLEVAYSSYDYRSGWNAAWGLMKDTELVTNKGAVYLFSTDAALRDRWLSALAALEAKGVGDRTPEGFGQIRVCDEFHLVFREEAV